MIETGEIDPKAKATCELSFSGSGRKMESVTWDVI